MSLTSMLNETVVITKRAASAVPDAYGDLIPTITTITTVGSLQQHARKEDESAGELSDTSWLLIMPAGTLVDTGDAITVNDLRYELVGDPWHLINPRTGREHHVEATVRRAQ